MKKTFKSIPILITILALFVLASCAKDEYQNSIKNSSSKTDITFEQFKKETGLINFETSIKINPSSDNLNARNADGTYELTDFIIDTELIKILVVEEKTTYTFVIQPKIIINRNVYNLTVFNINGQWKTSIIELIPTEQNRIDIKNGITDKFEGEINKIYDDSKTVNNLIGARVIIISHCVGCVGECDTCDECETTLIINEQATSFGASTLLVPPSGGNYGGQHNSGSGGNIVGNPYYQDPSGYAFIPNLSSIEDEEASVRIQKATEFWNSLTDVVGGEQEWAFEHPEEYNVILNKLLDNYTSLNRQFSKGLINLAMVEPDQADISKLINISVLVQYSENNFFKDEFELSLDQYLDIDVATFQNEHFPGLIAMQYHMNYKRLRQLNPEWPAYRCAWEAGKDIIHLSLDVFGLVPVIGEPADLINGVLYTIDDDHVNATLSYASALPIIGYGSAATKFSLKFINSTQTAYVISTRVKLIWKITSNGIEFGDRAQLRKVLGLAPIAVDARQAHHLIPWSSRTKMVVQKAAKYESAFHMNEALNGIAVAAWRNQPNHTQYNNLINSRLDNFRDDFPNATPQQCYAFLTNLIQDIRTWVINHPNSHLNDLVLP